ncbi:hypothetical protein [Haladaptatus sp. T7]|uniref:hypothetical protein n=1 Tax=Haladaptatus sp. T7 TaxID=2029368 RepID=UPI002231A157|nr:hypothetical protein [Haladaptatus sp. T7]
MMNQNSPTLPTLGSGITLLEVDDRTTGALQSLVLDHLLLEDGSAIWVDAQRHGATQPLAQIAPSMRLLDRIRIARAFTPWQHSSLLRDLKSAVTADTTLVILPAFDWFYRSDDLGQGDGKRMLAAGLEFVTELAAETDSPILVTLDSDDSFTAPIRAAVDDVVRCRGTTFGPRFTGNDFETLVYSLENGLVQTTFAFWKQVLTTRHPSIEGASATTRTEVSLHGAN